MNAFPGKNPLGEIYPQYKDLFTEITDKSAPKGDKIGNAYQFLGYSTSGEASDWILMSTGIPAVSPELGTEEECSDEFFIHDIGCIVRTLDAQYPLVKTTFKKIGSQIDIQASGFDAGQANLKITNKGLSNASDTWITLNSSSNFNLEAVNAYDPFTYDSDPRGKKIELGLKKLSNKEYSHLITIPHVHSRRHLNLELIGEMMDVKSLEFSFKEYNTDVSMKTKSIVTVPEKTYYLMNFTQFSTPKLNGAWLWGLIILGLVSLGAAIWCLVTMKCAEDKDVKKSDTAPASENYTTLEA